MGTAVWLTEAPYISPGDDVINGRGGPTCTLTVMLAMTPGGDTNPPLQPRRSQGKIRRTRGE